MNSEKYYNELSDYPFKAVGLIRDTAIARRFAKVGLILFLIVLIGLFFPWTQNIRSYGSLTAYLPQDRPQTVQSVIAGQISNWYVREGQHVRKGDTIVELTEVREKFFDPELLTRKKEQLDAKSNSLISGSDKIVALQNQIRTLRVEQNLSLKQAGNKYLQAGLKIQADSADLEAAVTDLKIATFQRNRADSLYAKGLISLNELERRNLKFQETVSKKVALESKLLSSRNELINAGIELYSIRAEYDTKISKAESDLNSAQMYVFENEGELASMKNEYSNLSIRNRFYFITAPQDGYIVRASISGVGETINEGEAICSILPDSSHLAVELYVKPMDIPLLKKGGKVRLQFDGWPALVFSGWPNYTFGTFGGKVEVIDNVDTEGHYRILVLPDPDDEAWPQQIRVGSGAYGWIMLKDVPIWYELWRQFNGFPPDYTGSPASSGSSKENNSKSSKTLDKDS